MWRLVLVIALVSASSTTPNTYLRSLCGFPVLNGAAGSPVTPTMMAQGLLGVALGTDAVPVDGQWGSTTTAAL